MVKASTAPPMSRLMVTKVSAVISNAKPTPPSRQATPLVRKAMRMTRVPRLSAKAGARKSEERPKQSVHPSMFTASRTPWGLAWTKGASPSVVPARRLKRTAVNWTK